MSTVLIADDQADVRSALALLVEGSRSLRLVGVAGDAEEAIELAERHRPDIALLDVRMPGGGGQHAAREIASRSPSTRVVAISAYEDRGSVFQMLRAGAVGYLVKGSSAHEILDTIDRTLRGEGVLSPQVTADVVTAFAGHLEREEQSRESYRTVADRVQEALREGALSTVYQPIVRLETGQVVGYEALSRFADRSRPPDEWFADAERVGMSTELELAAVQSALAGLKALPREAFVTVNISPRELLSDPVSEALAASPAGRVVVEITEHAAVSDYEELTCALAPFRARGGRVAVDDAGAGFASLRHVLELAPDMIKIDGTLVRAVGAVPGARALTASLAVFAQEMGICVVAEGIEDGSTIDLLRGLGVELGQGFHLGRPEAPS